MDPRSPTCRLAGLLLPLLPLLGTLPVTPAAACHIPQSLESLIGAARDVVIVRVDAVTGPEYGQIAQVTVERSFKGAIEPGTLELPFTYDSWTTGQSTTWASGVVAFHFEVGARYLAVVEESAVRDSIPDDRPPKANTRFEVVDYPEHMLAAVSGEADPAIWLVERMLALIAAGDEAQRLEILRPLLEHPDATVRLEAVHSLASVGSPAGTGLLLERLEDDSDRDVRRAVVDALRERSDRDPAITAGLLRVARVESTEEWVRTSAIRALGERRSIEAIPELMGLYSDEHLRSSVTSSILAMHHPSTLQFLIQSYKDGRIGGQPDFVFYPVAEMGTRDAAEFAMHALEESGPPEAPSPADSTPEASERERALRKNLRDHAVQALGVLGFTEFFPRLTAWLPPPCTADPGPSALWALGELGGRDARPLFDAYAACAGETTRTYLERELATLDRSDAVWSLAKRIGDDSPRFAEEAVWRYLGQ